MGSEMCIRDSPEATCCCWNCGDHAGDFGSILFRQDLGASVAAASLVGSSHRRTPGAVWSLDRRLDAYGVRWYRFLSDAACSVWLSGLIRWACHLGARQCAGLLCRRVRDSSGQLVTVVAKESVFIAVAAPSALDDWICGGNVSGCRAAKCVGSR